MTDITLVIGGCRSGKSRVALETAAGIAGPRIFIATAEPFDEEMRARVKAHRAQRGSGWTTVEAPRELPEAVAAHAAAAGGVVLVDCLTLWITNLMLESEDASRMDDRVGRLVAALQESRAPVILVANEVGAGIVPENRLARLFRDAAGSANQAVAACADKVIWVVAGIPVRIK
jgi:adenosylcobinamide kinase/adenosylcobinamide-phosphate guanylyltransferase